MQNKGSTHIKKGAFNFSSAPSYPNKGWNDGLPALESMSSDGTGNYAISLNITLESGKTEKGTFALRDHNQDGGFVEYGFFDGNANPIAQSESVAWECLPLSATLNN